MKGLQKLSPNLFKMEFSYHVMVSSTVVAPPSPQSSSFALNIWGIVIICLITVVVATVLYFCIRRKIFPFLRQQSARKGWYLIFFTHPKSLKDED